MVSMVAFAENTEHYTKTPPRARGQDRSYTLSALRCSKMSPQAALRETASQKCTQLGACSRDPIGFLGGYNWFGSGHRRQITQTLLGCDMRPVES